MNNFERIKSMDMPQMMMEIANLMTLAKLGSDEDWDEFVLLRYKYAVWVEQYLKKEQGK